MNYRVYSLNSIFISLTMTMTSIQQLLLSLFFVIPSLSISQTVFYQESFDDFPNPDRGFYTPINGVSSNFIPLSESHMVALRTTEFTPWQGNYQVTTSIIFRHYILDDFVNSSISNDFLEKIQADFDAARNAGVRLLLRFSYTITPPSGSCGSWICPPYGDATKAQVLAHIAQLKPLFQSNEDVILALQNGFIGVWGEQYYTDHFGDASVQGKLTDQNWFDRIEVLAALLDALPKSRMVQVRYPQMKQKYVFGVNAGIDSEPMGVLKAYDGSDLSRIGFHNDCFLSASDDQGTYWDYGSSSTGASNQTSTLKNYQAADSKYNLVGGETCSDAFSPQNNCENEGGQAVSDMNMLNYSYLNSDYNNDVNNDWQSGGCMDEIRRKLGYRFVLLNSELTNQVDQAGEIQFKLVLENVGFSTPVIKRDFFLVLRNTESNIVYSIELEGAEFDCRFWLPDGEVRLDTSISLPASMNPGNYNVFLALRDSSKNGSILNRPEYSIRMANDNVWDEATGLNDLKQTIQISSVLDLSEEKVEGLHVFPDPSTRNVTISSYRGGLWQLMNIYGNAVLSGEGTDLNLEGLPEGVYFLKINGVTKRLQKVHRF